MLKWVEGWRFDASITDPEVFRSRLDEGRVVSGLFLVTLSRTPHNLMEIIPAWMLPAVQRCSKDPVPIIGMAMGKDRAIRLVRDIITETMETSGSLSLEEFLWKGMKGTSDA